MKVPGLLKKLNRTYSIVIIPTSNDSVHRLNIKAPLIKFMFVLTLLLALSVSLYWNLSIAVEEQEKVNFSLEQQIQTLTKTILEQSATLQMSNGQLTAIQQADGTLKEKVNNFSITFSNITNDYVAKSNRGTSSKNTSNAIQDIIKLSTLVEELNRDLNQNEQITYELQKSNEALNKFVDAIPTFVPSQGKITSPFGTRKHPITKRRAQHNGVDIDSPKGASIKAAASGEVIYSGYSSGFGYHIIIDHKNGFQTTYAHSSKLIAKKGDFVSKGQEIALVGSTGLSTGPHLHFELKVNGTVVDPTQYIDFNS